MNITHFTVRSISHNLHVQVAILAVTCLIWVCADAFISVGIQPGLPPPRTVVGQFIIKRLNVDTNMFKNVKYVIPIIPSKI